KEAGATVLRTVCLGGRRYETFKTLEDWENFKTQSWESLVRAEKVVSKHGVKLAFENHKDWRLWDQLELLMRMHSEWVGVCFDFGNNLSLLEDPHVQAEVLAPFIMTTHLKDMGAQMYEDGFLLSEVPLGEGMLDLAKICDICESANPDIQFNLEMITRDPLKIPFMRDDYWVPMPMLPARDLVSTLKRIKQHPPQKPLPTISDKSDEQCLAYEEANVRQCFQYAKEQLGLS
ncbi:MAG: sugar phosphate isomerase/epimerase, partial [Verrucomicrobia bacterium]|nr:sugar phosphate isomerase/epimerase [Verrucomicrobiota bacterium]